MKIEKERDKLLTNFEVLQHVDDIKSRQAKSRHKSDNKNHLLNNLITEVQEYLQKRPAGNPSFPQTPENISSFMHAMSKFKLEKAERLQIIDSAPQSIPVIYTMIEECEQRFSEAEVEEMLALVDEYLGKEPGSQNEPES